MDEQKDDEQENFFKITKKSGQKSKRFKKDPWLAVPHQDLFARKAAVYDPKKNSNDVHKITAYSEIIRQKQPKLKRTNLSKRKAIQVDTVELSVSQLVKIKLKDYNSIEYQLRVS